MATNDTTYREHQKFANEAGAKLTLEVFGVNDVDEASSTLTYVGSQAPKGTWMIERIDTSSGFVVTYATVENNSSVTTYSQAWTNRATLIYDAYATAF